MIKSIETEHLILRKATMDDLESIWRNVWSQEELAINMLWETTSRIEDAKSRLERTIAFQKDHYGYFICLKGSSEAIGFAGITELSKKGVYEDCGICITQRYQGRGYAKEVVRAFQKLIFEDLKGEGFVYGCQRRNERSRNVCLALGFQYLYSREKEREKDHLKYTADFYYYSREMYWRNKSMEEKEIEVEPLFQEYVDFDTFSKSDFRVVRILDCVAVPKSKKLLQFTLDDGTGENRTILSGIHAYYEPEELVGKNVVAILNLPPRNMMGIDSCGMLLSAVHTENGEEKLHLMIVDDFIPAGAKLY